MAKPRNFKQYQPQIIVISLLIIIGLSLFFLITMPENDVPPWPSQSPPPSSKEVNFDGSLACLPHKDSSGPQTLECAYGLKSDSGQYYALDTVSFPSTLISELPTGTKVSVTGILSNSTDDHLKTYDITGVIRVLAVNQR